MQVLQLVCRLNLKEKQKILSKNSGQINFLQTWQHNFSPLTEGVAQEFAVE